MNSSMACPYDSCELAAASEFRTAFFECSKSGSRSIVFARERLLVFFRRPILAASCAAFSMVIHSEADGLEPRLWLVTGTLRMVREDSTPRILLTGQIVEL